MYTLNLQHDSFQSDLTAGDTSSTELTQISAGQLHLVRPGSIQGSRECLFVNAMATIRRTTQEFNFQLVVTRVYEEGEQELLDEDEESWSTLVLYLLYTNILESTR